MKCVLGVDRVPMTRALLLAALAMCGCLKPAPQDCTPKSCNGCCDEMGRCVPGDTVSACGRAGAACQACSSPTEGTSTCTSGACGAQCTQGFHVCRGQCVPNTSVTACGSRCEPCPAPAGATATCDGTTCGIDCGEARHVCGDVCVSDFDLNSCANTCTPCLTRPNGITTCQPDAGGCLLTCQSGFRLCAAECRADSVASCGDSCSICSAPDGGIPSCDGGTCSFECRTGLFRCRDGCCKPTNVWLSNLAGRSHVLASSGEVYGWGTQGTLDLLGVGNINSHSFPVPAPAFGDGVVSMALGNLHTCAVYRDGGTRCLGGGTSGQLGDGQRQTSTVPVQVVGLPGVPSQLALGDFQSFALVNGAVYGWGTTGSVDDAGVSTPSNIAMPYHADLMTGVTFIASGQYHRCAVKQQQAWCWGINNDGELGAGRPNGRTIPLPVQGIDAGVTSVSLSQDHSCAVAGGEVWCWGLNNWRQVWWGSGDMWVDRPLKVVGAGSDVVAVATGGRSTCVLKGPAGARSIMCWGSGALGDGVNQQQRTQPATVVNIGGNVQAFAAAGAHHCAIMNQELWCWGGGGTVGHGLSADALTPVPITSP